LLVVGIKGVMFGGNQVITIFVVSCDQLFSEIDLRGPTFYHAAL
jgi:hypothetical protein